MELWNQVQHYTTLKATVSSQSLCSEESGRKSIPEIAQWVEQCEANIRSEN